MINPSASHRVVSRWKVDLAARWYTIQSETLHIPDRFGFFTPGASPPSQVSEVESVIRLLVCQLCLALFYPLCIIRLPHVGLSRALGGLGIILGAQFIVFGIFWAFAYSRPRPSSKDRGTWQYRDYDTGHIHYWEEIFECFWRGWGNFVLVHLVFCLVFFIDWSWVWRRVVAVILDEARKMLCGH